MKVSDEDSLSGLQMSAKAVYSHGRERVDSLVSLLIRTLIPFCGTHPHDVS